jgi:hypothetical protein
MLSQTLPCSRQFQAHERLVGTARIAPDCQPSGSDVSSEPVSSASSSSSPLSNGSQSCTGFLYGATDCDSLGACGRAGFSISRSIGQSFAREALQSAIGALYIVHPERDPIAVPEIEFGEIAMQMCLADVVIAAHRISGGFRIF